MITTRALDWVFVCGVRHQLDSLGQGFNTVFPLDKLEENGIKKNLVYQFAPTCFFS